MITITNLTKKLVSIPSWVDGQNNEIEIGNYIFDWLLTNTNLKIIKQPVSDGRFNILALCQGVVNTLIIGHIDTVANNNNQLKQVGNKLFGRGTTDMKGGLAAMMLFATKKDLKNVGFLFYIDEEYNFLGIEKFIKDYSQEIIPKSIVSLDGSELEISNGCRGLIEISAEIVGQSCHAATPENGLNAIEVALMATTKLKQYLSKYSDPELGPTSLNLGKISGGNFANIVPGNCQITLDIRPSSSKINGKLVVAKLKDIVNKLGASTTNIKINFDFSCWLTPKKSLEKLNQPFKDIKKSGYIDIQLLWLQYKKIPACLTIGAGCQKMAHADNEFIEVDKLKKLPKILENIINCLQC